MAFEILLIVSLCHTLQKNTLRAIETIAASRGPPGTRKALAALRNVGVKPMLIDSVEAWAFREHAWSSSRLDTIGH